MGRPWRGEAVGSQSDERCIRPRVGRRGVGPRHRQTVASGGLAWFQGNFLGDIEECARDTTETKQTIKSVVANAPPTLQYSTGSLPLFPCHVWIDRSIYRWVLWVSLRLLRAFAGNVKKKKSVDKAMNPVDDPTPVWEVSMIDSLTGGFRTPAFPSDSGGRRPLHPPEAGQFVRRCLGRLPRHAVRDCEAKDKRGKTLPAWHL